MKKFLMSGILAGIAIFVVWLVMGMIISMIWPYNILELGGMRAAADPMMMLFFLHPFVFGFAMAFVYPYVAGSLKGEYMDKGKMFGLLMWLVAGIPSAFVVFTSMNYPIGFTINSVVGSFIYMLIAGIAIAWANK